MSEHLERVARLLCSQHGGDPDAVATEEHDCWDGPLWTAFTKYAEAIVAITDPRITQLEADRAVATAALTEIAELNPLSIAGGLDNDGLILTNAFLTSRTAAREALSRISGEDRHG